MAGAAPTIDSPPPANRRMPQSLRIFISALLLLTGGSALAIGVPIWRKQSAIAAVEKAGASVGKVSGGPTWLRRALGDEWMWYLDEVVQVRFRGSRATDADLAGL